MTEKYSIERSESRERLSFDAVAVSNENVKVLEKLRTEIDGEENASGDKFASELRRYESGDNHKGFLVEVDKKAVGYVEVDLHEDYIPKGADKVLCKELQQYAHIARIGLLPEHRGKGLGTTLLQHAEDWVKSQNSKAIWLDYLPESENLIKFYESAGYQTFTEFKDGEKSRMRRIAVKHF